jgi:hypothetical protein
LSFLALAALEIVLEEARSRARIDLDDPRGVVSRCGRSACGVPVESTARPSGRRSRQPTETSSSRISAFEGPSFVTTTAGVLGSGARCAL